MEIEISDKSNSNNTNNNNFNAQENAIRGTWHGPLQRSANTNIPRRGGHSAAIIGSKAYIFGGSFPPQKKNQSGPKEISLSLVSEDLWIVECSQMQFQKVEVRQGTGPSARYAHSCTAINDKIAVFGGFNGTRYLDDIHIFDTSCDSWITPNTANQRIPEPRYAHSANFVKDSNLVVFGGCGQSSVFNDLWVFDLNSMTWQEMKPSGVPPSPRAYHTANLIDMCLFVFGGRAGREYYNDLYVLNLEYQNWNKIATNCPSPRAYHVSLVHQHYLLVYGGIDGNQIFNQIVIFDSHTQGWRAVDFESFPNAKMVNLPPPRHKHAGWVFENNFWFFGGIENPSSAFSDLYVLSLDLPQDRFSLSNEMDKLQKLNLASSNSQQQQQPQTQSQQLSHGFHHIEGPVTTRTHNQPSNTALSGQAHPQSQPQPQPEPQQQPSPDYVRQLETQLFNLQTEYDFLTLKNLDSLSFHHLEKLEEHFLDSIQRISKAKVKKMMVTYEAKLTEEIHKTRYEKQISSQLDKENQQLRQLLIDHNITAPQSASFLSSFNSQQLAQDGPLKSVPISKKRNGVEFGVVESFDFKPLIGQGVPSEGGAPLGMSDKVSKTAVDYIDRYEVRRQFERKGVNKINYEDRVKILTESGISEDIVKQEDRSLENLNWGRLQSISSPTENPLPPQQREIYKKALENPQFKQFF